MARLAAILRALRQAIRRDQKSVFSVGSNSFFMASLLVMQDAGLFIFLLVALVVIVPLSSNPSQKIPLSRLRSWPLSRAEIWILRMASPWVNPITWLLALLLIAVEAQKITSGIWLFIAMIVSGGFVASSLPKNVEHAVFRHMPRFPGILNQLIRKDLRQVLSVLDLYLAGLLSGITAFMRLTGVDLPQHGLMILTALVVLALSSYTLSLFGPDVSSGLSRYRLLPLRGWQLLLSKDLAVLLVSLPLLAPLQAMPGLGATLVALAIGHRASVRVARMQSRWRFSRGAPFLPIGLAQTFGITSAGALVFFHGPLLLVPCIAVWLLSIRRYGRVIERGVAWIDTSTGRRHLLWPA